MCSREYEVRLNRTVLSTIRFSLIRKVNKEVRVVREGVYWGCSVYVLGERTEGERSKRHREDTSGLP